MCTPLYLYCTVCCTYVPFLGGTQPTGTAFTVVSTGTVQYKLYRYSAASTRTVQPTVLVLTLETDYLYARAVHLVLGFVAARGHDRRADIRGPSLAGTVLPVLVVMSLLLGPLGYRYSQYQYCTY